MDNDTLPDYLGGANGLSNAPRLITQPKSPTDSVDQDPNKIEFKTHLKNKNTRSFATTATHSLKSSDVSLSNS